MRRINLRKLVPVFLIALGIFLMNAPLVMKETQYIDYSSPNIQDAIIGIKSTTQTDKERILKTADFVFKNVNYEIMGPMCFSQTASAVLEIGEGDCVSMSKAVAAILSGMDIPVKIVEGCIFADADNRAREFIIPHDPYVKGGAINAFKVDFFSRLSSVGQLHNWVRAYDGVNWWSIETTAGIIFPSNLEDALGYDRYGDFVNPSDSKDLCLLQDPSYVSFCLSGE